MYNKPIVLHDIVLSFMIQNVKNSYMSLDARYPVQVKIFRFLISGGVSATVDLALLYIFTEFFGLWYLASTVCAFILAFFVSFGLQKFWTFRDHSREGISAQAGIYFLIATGNLVLNTFLVYVFVDHLGLHYLIAQSTASILIACGSYFIYQQFVFRRTTI